MGQIATAFPTLKLYRMYIYIPFLTLNIYTLMTI